MNYDPHSFLVGLFVQFELVLLGFVLPLVSALLSLLPEATYLLGERYKNQIKQSKDNLKSAADSKEDADIDVDKLQLAVNELESNRRSAKLKLWFLRPKNAIVLTSLALLSSALFSIFTLFPADSDGTRFLVKCFYGVSFAALISGGWSLWVLFQLLIEATELNNTSKRDYDNKVVELLTRLAAASSTEELFIPASKIDITFGKTSVNEKYDQSFSLNNKQTLLVCVNNDDIRMIKNWELGIILPKEFLLEKTSNISSVYVDNEEQIVRFNIDMIYADENRNFGDLSFTPMKVGTYKVVVFAKAENVKPFDYTIKLNIVS